MLITSFLTVNCLYSLKGYFSGDEIKTDEMGGLCNTYGGEDGFIQGFGVDT